MRALLGLGALLFLGWTASTAINQIGPGERGVVKRLGRLLRERPGPGLFIGWPWGIDRVERVAIGRVRTIVLDFGGPAIDDELNEPLAGQMLTGDHNLVRVQAEVNFKVIEEKVDRFAIHQDRVEPILFRATEAALAEWIAGRTVDEVLVEGKLVLPRRLAIRVQELVDEHDLGVHVEQASVTKLHPPARVKASFDRLTEAQTGIRTQVNQAEQDAQRRVSETESEIFRLRTETTTYAREQKYQAEAETSAFLKQLTEYRRATSVNPNALNVLWLDRLTSLFAKMREERRIAPLDHTLGADGFNITEILPLTRKK